MNGRGGTSRWTPPTAESYTGVGLPDAQRLVLGSWKPSETDGLESLFGRPFVRLTGGAPAVPIGESRVPSGNAPFEGLEDLNVDMTLAGEGVSLVAIAPKNSSECDPALDQTMEEVVDDLVAKGNQALAEDAREAAEERASREVQATHSAWLELINELVGPSA